MPTYEFRCPTGHDFEKFYRSIGTAPSIVACPVCGKTAERQLSAGGGLVFKGSGFYITDYGKDGKKSQAAVPPATEGAKTTGSDAAKSESGKSEPASGVSKSSSESTASAPAKPPAEKSSSKRAKDKE